MFKNCLVLIFMFVLSLKKKKKNNVDASGRKDLIFADFSCIRYTYFPVPAKFKVFAVSTKIIRVVTT